MMGTEVCTSVNMTSHPASCGRNDNMKMGNSK
jgi:hypothetical protein